MLKTHVSLNAKYAKLCGGNVPQLARHFGRVSNVRFYEDCVLSVLSYQQMYG